MCQWEHVRAKTLIRFELNEEQNEIDIEEMKSVRRVCPIDNQFKVAINSHTKVLNQQIYAELTSRQGKHDRRT